MNSFIVFFFIFATITVTSNSQYVLPITKHEPTNQFYTTLNIAKSPINLLLDLETNLTWLNCRKLKSLSSLRLITCQSSTCKSIPQNQCNNNNKSCLYKQPNPLGLIITSRVVQDTVSISTTDGAKVSLRHFTFSCAGEKALKGLPSTVSGVLSISPGSLSFWKQVTSGFNVIPKFSLCLPSSSSNTGRFFIGGDVNGSPSPILMTETPLKGTGSGDYVLSVQSIYVGGTPLKLNSFEAKLSSLIHYTVLQTDLYNALAQSFELKAKAMGISKVPSVSPFKHCFDASTVGTNMTGPNVPVIEFGLPGRIGEVKWSFYGANTVVKVKETVMCLAFIDGGKKTKESMVIGTYQLQDYVIEFDFSRTTFVFSDSLLLHNSGCGSTSEM